MMIIEEALMPFLLSNMKTCGKWWVIGAVIQKAIFSNTICGIRIGEYELLLEMMGYWCHSDYDCVTHLCWVISAFRLITSMIWMKRFHDNSSTDISSTTLRLQTFRLLLYTSVQDSYTCNFCFSKSLFSSIPTSAYTMIPFYQSHFH